MSGGHLSAAGAQQLGALLPAHHGALGQVEGEGANEGSGGEGGHRSFAGGTPGHTALGVRAFYLKLNDGPGPQSRGSFRSTGRGGKAGSVSSCRSRRPRGSGCSRHPCPAQHSGFRSEQSQAHRKVLGFLAGRWLLPQHRGLSEDPHHPSGDSGSLADALA